MFMRVTLRKRVPRNVGRVKPVRTAIRARRAFVDGSFQPATVVLDGGCIVDILGARERVDTEWRVLVPDDAVLLPGLVDSHVHVNEPGRTEWEGFRSATLAAAAGGAGEIRIECYGAAA